MDEIRHPLTYEIRHAYNAGMNASELIDKLGGTSAVANICGVRAPSVSEWRIRGIPADRCSAIERATSGAVTCEELRPDVAWVRIPDLDWPHPQGRPLVDHAAKRAADQLQGAGS